MENKNVIITPMVPNGKYNTMLGPSVKKVGMKCLCVSDTEDSGVIKSTSFKYNTGIDIIKEHNMVFDDNIIIFTKNDVFIMDNMLNEKLDFVFTHQPNLGVLGVAGVKELHSGKELYNKVNSPLNGLVYTTENDNNGMHILYSDRCYYEDVIALDDSFIAVKGSLINKGFKLEVDTNVGYGIEFAQKAISFGYNSAVADILILSDSKTNISFEGVDRVVSDLNLSYPVKPSSVIRSTNSVIDIEL
jgi:hypothetical protein